MIEQVKKSILLVGIGIGGKGIGGVQGKGTRFLGKTRILYLVLFLVLFHLHVLNIGFLS